MNNVLLISYPAGDSISFTAYISSSLKLHKPDDAKVHLPFASVVAVTIDPDPYLNGTYPASSELDFPSDESYMYNWNLAP